MSTPRDAYGLDVKYHAANGRTIKVALENFAKNEAKKKVIGLLKQCAQMLVDMVDGKFVPFQHPLPYGGNENYPVWVGQMHDATGVGIYNDGKVIQYLPTKKALDSQPQMDMAHNDFDIIGNERLRMAIQAGLTQFSKGLWIVLFCAVPYANIVNTKGSPWGRGVYFFDTFSEELFWSITNGLSAMKL